MKVFITGGNGFLGLNIIHALIASGIEVRALVRESSNLNYIPSDNVELVKGDLKNVEKLIKKIEGCDAVIHTAGITSSDKRDCKKLYDTNVIATQNVITAALENKIKRFVYTSTTSAIGANDSGIEQATEDTPLVGFRAKNPYGISKIHAEKLLLEAMNHGLEPVILNPAEIVGPFDYNFQWGRIVLAVQHNQLPILPPGGGSFCHSKDVGDAHVSALTNGRPGQRYILAGHDILFSDYIAQIESALGKNCDYPSESYKTTYYKAILHEKMPFIFKKAPAVEAYRMRVFSGQYYFSSKKASTEFGYESRSIGEMISDSISCTKKKALFNDIDTISGIGKLFDII